MKTKNLQKLYDIDEDLWLEETIKLLQRRDYENLDTDNLIEELEFLGKRQKVAVESLLEQVIRHLLLFDYWQVEKARAGNHWQVEIKSFRKQLNKILTTNLRKHLLNLLPSIYEDALEYVQGKTDYQVEFPSECPYTLDELLKL